MKSHVRIETFALEKFPYELKQSIIESPIIKRVRNGSKLEHETQLDLRRCHRRFPSTHLSLFGVGMEIDNQMLFHPLASLLS